MSFFSYLDAQSDITDITWRNRKRFAPMDRFSHHIMRGKSELSYAQRELIAAFVSALNACQFCFGSHRAVAQQYGVNVTLLEQLVEDTETKNLDARLQPIMKYVKKLTLSPSKVIQADVDDIIRAGWNEETVQDVIAIVCLFNFYNRLLDGHGVKGSKAIYQFAGDHLSKRGYGVPWFINLIAPMIRKQKAEYLKQEAP